MANHRRMRPFHLCSLSPERYFPHLGHVRVRSLGISSMGQRHSINQRLQMLSPNVFLYFLNFASTESSGQSVSRNIKSRMNGIPLCPQVLNALVNSKSDLYAWLGRLHFRHGWIDLFRIRINFLLL